MQHSKFTEATSNRLAQSRNKTTTKYTGIWCSGRERLSLLGLNKSVTLILGTEQKKASLQIFVFVASNFRTSSSLWEQRFFFIFLHAIMLCSSFDT